MIERNYGCLSMLLFTKNESIESSQKYCVILQDDNRNAYSHNMNPQGLMRKRTICLLTFLLILFGCLVGCGPSERELNGEVFVVTQGGQNIRLGLVEVGVFAESDIIPFIQKKLQRAKYEKRELETVLDSVKKASEQSAKELAYLRKQMKVNSEGTDELSLNELRYRLDWQIKNLLLFKEAGERHDKRLKEHFDVLKLIHSYLEGEFYLSGLPEPLQTTKTDSDGEFNFKLKPGKYAIAAKSSRKIIDSSEAYYWLIWLTIDGVPTKKLMLSNDNLFETHCADCIIKTADLLY
ncbi:MAG: hypothetical protein Q8K98_03490 [Bacteroidota bacterium]|nr:hypothetical protein [Bacteroidota bacterium]